jgi:hypothetical protein
MKSRQLVPKTGRVTNVKPWPKKAARQLYKQADDDAKALRMFMAAQANFVEERPLLDFN